MCEAIGEFSITIKMSKETMLNRATWICHFRGRKFIKIWLANMFGDYYTRKGLSTKQRELITFYFLMAQGGCEAQLKAHVIGNLNVGNDKRFLISIASQCVPYIGYPRVLNALSCINAGFAEWEANQ